MVINVATTRQDDTKLHLGVVYAFLDGVHADMPKWWPLLEKANRNTLGMEMESGPFCKACLDHFQSGEAEPFGSFFFMKGVMDYGTQEKDDNYKKYGSLVSALLALDFIHEHGWMAYLGRFNK